MIQADAVTMRIDPPKRPVDLHKRHGLDGLFKQVARNSVRERSARCRAGHKARRFNQKVSEVGSLAAIRPSVASEDRQELIRERAQARRRATSAVELADGLVVAFALGDQRRDEPGRIKTERRRSNPAKRANDLVNNLICKSIVTIVVDGSQQLDCKVERLAPARCRGRRAGTVAQDGDHDALSRGMSCEDSRNDLAEIGAGRDPIDDIAEPRVDTEEAGRHQPAMPRFLVEVRQIARRRSGPISGFESAGHERLSHSGSVPICS